MSVYHNHHPRLILLYIHENSFHLYYYYFDFVWLYLVLFDNFLILYPTSLTSCSEARIAKQSKTIEEIVPPKLFAMFFTSLALSWNLPLDDEKIVTNAFKEYCEISSSPILHDTDIIWLTCEFYCWNDSLLVPVDSDSYFH